MYNTDGLMHVSERILWEVLDVADAARDSYEGGRDPFDNKSFYEGYKQACADIHARLSKPLQGAQ